MKRENVKKNDTTADDLVYVLSVLIDCHGCYHMHEQMFKNVYCQAP